jgi:hypothetical protein
VILGTTRALRVFAFPAPVDLRKGYIVPGSKHGHVVFYRLDELCSRGTHRYRALRRAGVGHSRL